MHFKLWLESQYKYAVVLFEMPADLSSKIISFSQKFIPKSCLSEDGREDEPHVTVLYGLNDKDFEKVKEKIKDFKQFNIRLGSISKFDNKEKYDVLKIDVIGDSIRKLNKKIKEIPHYSNYNEYKPHCTLAYVKKDSCNSLLKNNHFENTVIKIKSVNFIDTSKNKKIIKLQES